MLFIPHKVCLIIRFMNIWLNKIDHVLQNQHSVGIYIAINLPKMIRIRRLKIILNLTFKIIALNRSFWLLFHILLFFILIDSYLDMTSYLDWNLAVMPIDCFAILQFPPTVFLSRLLFLTLARLLCPGNDVITTLILLLVSMTACFHWLSLMKLIHTQLIINSAPNVVRRWARNRVDYMTVRNEKHSWEDSKVRSDIERFAVNQLPFCSIHMEFRERQSSLRFRWQAEILSTFQRFSFHQWDRTSQQRYRKFCCLNKEQWITER